MKNNTYNNIMFTACVIYLTVTNRYLSVNDNLDKVVSSFCIVFVLYYVTKMFINKKN